MSGIHRSGGLEDTLRAVAAFPDSQLALLHRTERPQRRIKGTGQAYVLGEPPTAREVTVLRLLRGTLTTRQIAQEQWASANTIKSHGRAIYRKLGVSSRRDAIQRGSELGAL